MAPIAACWALSISLSSPAIQSRPKAPYGNTLTRLTCAAFSASLAAATTHVAG